MGWPGNRYARCPNFILPARFPPRPDPGPRASRRSHPLGPRASRQPHPSSPAHPAAAAAREAPALELLLLGRALERPRRRLPAGDHFLERVEPARAHERLVLDRRVALRGGQLELAVLKPRVRGHSAVTVAP